MTKKTYFPAGPKITLADGTYKNIEDVVEGDGVQTYEMSTEDFDSANLHLNEQTDTKVKSTYSEEANLKDFIKIEFKQYVDPEIVDDDVEELEDKDIESLTVNKYGTLNFLVENRKMQIVYLVVGKENAGFRRLSNASSSTRPANIPIISVIFAPSDISTNFGASGTMACSNGPALEIITVAAAIAALASSSKNASARAIATRAKMKPKK